MTAFLLFLVAFLTLPLPLLGLEGSLVPVGRYLQLTLVMLGLLAHEGAGGMVGSLTGLFVVHTLVYTSLLALAAWLLGRFVLPRLSISACRTVALVATLVMIVGASFAPLYDTQFHHSSIHARLLELYW
jgi:hypothetical protein